MNLNTPKLLFFTEKDLSIFTKYYSNSPLTVNSSFNQFKF